MYSKEGSTSLKYFKIISSAGYEDPFVISLLSSSFDTPPSFLHQAALRTSRQPRHDWPYDGNLELSSYSTRYRDGLPLVLKNVDVKFQGGTKVNIFFIRGVTVKAFHLLLLFFALRTILLSALDIYR